MIHHITHPTKEQVRAYMAERELAHRPPPAPEEIRRKLGWRLAPSEPEPEPEPVVYQFCLLPSTYGQMAAQIAQIALDYMSAAARISSRPRD